MKLCSKCGRNPRRSATQRWCRECHAAYIRATRPTYAELSEDQKKRIRCRARSRAIDKRGEFDNQPLVCEKCGSTENVQRHHPDYDNPYKVARLCPACHREVARET